MRSKFGVAIGLPKQPRFPNPVSSSTTNSTFGAPLRARTGAGQAGLDSSVVRPMTPGKAAPAGYSTMGIDITSLLSSALGTWTARTNGYGTRSGCRVLFGVMYGPHGSVDCLWRWRPE